MLIITHQQVAVHHGNGTLQDYTLHTANTTASERMCHNVAAAVIGWLVGDVLQPLNFDDALSRACDSEQQVHQVQTQKKL